MRTYRDNEYALEDGNIEMPEGREIERKVQKKKSWRARKEERKRENEKRKRERLRKSAIPICDKASFIIIFLLIL